MTPTAITQQNYLLKTPINRVCVWTTRRESTKGGNAVSLPAIRTKARAAAGRGVLCDPDSSCEREGTGEVRQR